MIRLSPLKLIDHSYLFKLIIICVGGEGKLLYTGNILDVTLEHSLGTTALYYPSKGLAL